MHKCRFFQVINTCKYTHTHTYACIHTYTHTHIHTHMHTHTHTHTCSNNRNLTRTRDPLASLKSDTEHKHSIVFEDDPLGLHLPEGLADQPSNSSSFEELSSNSTSDIFKKVTVSAITSDPPCDSQLAPAVTMQSVPDPNRRFRYRKQQTLSFMLHDGESHEVWKPGRRQTKRRVHETKSEVCTCTIALST